MGMCVTCLMARVEKWADLSYFRHWKWIEERSSRIPVFVGSWGFIQSKRFIY